MDPYNSADALGAPVVNPYAAPAARVADAPVEAELVKSGRLARLGAVLIDSMVLVVPAILVAIVLPGMQDGSGGLSTGAGALLLLAGLGVIAFAIYQLVQLHRTGQTFGKKMVGVRIVRTDGSRASLGRIFGLRYLVPGVIGAIPLLGPLFSLVDPLLIFGEERRCIHDYIADTIVVDA
jgi:uncharacterized RDD family membrane protein YckC